MSTPRDKAKKREGRKAKALATVPAVASIVTAAGLRAATAGTTSGLALAIVAAVPGIVALAASGFMGDDRFVARLYADLGDHQMGRRSTATGTNR
jgi:hypothetical protein